MIIIENIILYFIQIRHIDDPLNGYPVSIDNMLRQSNTSVIGVCVKSPKYSMQSCTAARCQTNGERAPSLISINRREIT